MSLPSLSLAKTLLDSSLSLSSFYLLSFLLEIANSNQHFLFHIILVTPFPCIRTYKHTYNGSVVRIYQLDSTFIQAVFANMHPPHHSQTERKNPLESVVVILIFSSLQTHSLYFPPLMLYYHQARRTWPQFPLANHTHTHVVISLVNLQLSVRFPSRTSKPPTHKHTAFFSCL